MTEYMIKKEDIAYNIGKIREQFDGRIIGVIKCGGYGFGLEFMAEVLSENGVDVFAVTEPSDIERLRTAGFENDILLLGGTEIAETAAALVRLNASATVGSLAEAEILSSAALAAGKKAKSHIYIDTGMGRGGFDPDDAALFIPKLGEFENIEITGLYTHFTSALSDRKKTLEQFDAFRQVVSLFEMSGIRPDMVHAANTAALLSLPETRLNCVRAGSAFTGRTPADSAVQLRRVGILKTQVTAVKTIKKGGTVGYAGGYTASKEIKAAIIPVGNYDGFGMVSAPDINDFSTMVRVVGGGVKSCLAGRPFFTVTIGGKKYPTIGHICENNAVVDVSGSEVKAGDECLIDVNPLLVGGHIKRSII